MLYFSKHRPLNNLNVERISRHDVKGPFHENIHAKTFEIISNTKKIDRSIKVFWNSNYKYNKVKGLFFNLSEYF